MENSYIENFKSYTDWGTVIVRSNKTPLDRTSIFGSLEDAKKYAKGDASDKNKLGKTSYIGQFLAVHENDIIDIYQIIGDDTKSPIERSLRRVVHEVDLSNYSGETSEKLQQITDKLIKQSGTTYDCENGFLTLSTNNEENNIIIPLNSNYGTFETDITKFSKNRLQFVHCDILFNTSEEAKEYVNGNLISRDRPALFAEPMILKYGDIKNPNILLAIGSVGDGSSVDVNNKLFFIDCAEINKNSIKEYKDSSSISYNIEKNEDGIVFESNVKLQQLKSISGSNYNNIILSENDGLFSYVDVSIVDKNLIININGKIKEYKILDQILISNNDDNILIKNNDGLYANVSLNYDVLSNVITFNNGKEEKNISLSPFVISSEKTNSIENNIVITKSGTTITSDVLLSNDITNILKIVDNGLFTNVSLDYNKAQNKLIFATTNGEKEIQLSSHSLVTSGRYDPVEKKIILTITTDDNDGIKEVEIPVGDLVNILNVVNTVDSPIILNKTTDTISGVDTLTANIKISESSDNLIQISSNGTTSNLYASNRASKHIANWATINENGEIIYEEKTIQEIIGILQSYNSDNDITNGGIINRIIQLEERVNNLTDFGYTDIEE